MAPVSAWRKTVAASLFAYGVYLPWLGGGLWSLTHDYASLHARVCCTLSLVLGLAFLPVALLYRCAGHLPTPYGRTPVHMAVLTLIALSSFAVPLTCATDAFTERELLMSFLVTLSLCTALGLGMYILTAAVLSLLWLLACGMSSLFRHLRPARPLPAGA